MVVVVAGFGNVLLDFTITVENNSILKRYDLNPNDSKVISPDELKSMIFEIQKYDYITNSGGCTQNTLIILQWILKEKHSTAMFGAIGKDNSGEAVSEIAQAAGVKTRYAQKTEATGVIISFVNGVNRSLVGNIGASASYELKDLKSSENLDIFNEMKYAYMEGFFLPGCVTVGKYVLNFCKENRKRFIFNLSAQYLCQEISENIIHFAQNCDVLFGNIDEFEALRNIMGNYATYIQLVKDLSGSYKNLANYPYGKIIVVTNGSENVICCHSGDVIEELEVPQINIESIVDTTGAGDSFAAGFIAALLKELPPLIALKWGCWVSQHIIQQIGCNTPNVKVKPLFSITH